MSNTLFTSDLHINHDNLIMLRGFSCVDEYHNLLVKNWNNKVGKSDLVYILGDVIWKSKNNDSYNILRNLNGRKRIIKGNHDRRHDLKHMKANGIIEHFSDCEGVTIDDRYVWLSHYPHRSWNRSYHGSLHLYGHVHNTMQDYGLSTDVGVDKWNFTPVDFSEVLVYFKDRLIEFKKGTQS